MPSVKRIEHSPAECMYFSMKTFVNLSINMHEDFSLDFENYLESFLQKKQIR